MAEPIPFKGPIAYLTGEYPRATDTFIQREVAALRALGLRVHTCSIRRTDAAHHVGPEQQQEAAATFHVLEAAIAPHRLMAAHLGWLLRRPGAWLKALALAWRCAPPGLRGRLYQLFYFAEAGVLAAHLRKRGVRHLHNHIATASGTVAMLAGEIAGIPHSFTLHGPDIFFAPRRWRLDEKIARAAFVACISQFCRSQAMAFSDPAHWGKLHVVHCGIDPARYGPGPRGGEGLRLLFIGRLAPVKGLPVLLEALARIAGDHPGLTLDLIGDGPARGMLKAQAAALGLSDRVRFLGYRSQGAVAEALAECDMLVLPSFAEGLPVVLMEALAARLPVIATRIAGVPELVEDGVSGLLVPPGDVAALARAIGRLAGDAELRLKMGDAGARAVARGFSSRDEAARLARLFAACHGAADWPEPRSEAGP